jgi:8-oxo-dGTP pyrophosphatase MutT (NUDIX family)
LKLSSAVIFVKPKESPDENSDYEILLLKRNEKLTAFGGFYAFPGGVVDMPGDSFEHWSTHN